MRVLKFGGTSLATAEMIARVAGIVAEAASRERVAVVVSALAGVTDILVGVAEAAGRKELWLGDVERLRRRHFECLRRLTPNGSRGPAATALADRLRDLAGSLAEAASGPTCPDQVRDRILATGERLSAALVAAALTSSGLQAEAIDAGELVRTDSRFGDAVVDHAVTYARIRQRLGTLSLSTVPVVTGFIGSDAAGRTTTLGRGGSDHSASLVGAALMADVVEIWTDVDGVLSGPPRLLAGAATLDRLSYEEAAELAFFGAKVLHPETMRPLAALGIPIRVRSTMAPGLPGTRISAAPAATGGSAVAVTAVEDVAVLTAAPSAPGMRGTAGIVRALAAAGVEALAITQASARRGLVVVIAAAEAGRAARALEVEGGVEVRDGLALVAVVGHAVAREPGFVARLLADCVRATAVWAGASAHSVTVLVGRSELREALSLLHDRLLHEGGANETARAERIPGSPTQFPPSGTDLGRRDREASR